MLLKQPIAASLAFLCSPQQQSTKYSFYKPRFRHPFLFLTTTDSSVSKTQEEEEEDNMSLSNNEKNTKNTPTTNSRSRNNNNNNQRVVVVGSANQDLTSYTNTVPILGETVLGSLFETNCGGKGANQARACAAIALAPVTMICRVGTDVFGYNMIQNLQQSGVELEDTNTIMIDTTSSGVASITVDEQSGDNMIIVTPGANHVLTSNDVISSLIQLQPTIVIVQLEIKYDTALQALKTGRELGAITILNPAPAPENIHVLQDFLPFIDILIPNETELRTLCGGGGGSGDDGGGLVVDKPLNNNKNTKNEETMAQSLLQAGVRKSVICTLGARGAMIVEKKRTTTTTTTTTDDNQDTVFDIQYVDAPIDLPARQEPIIDTIGAGDAFCGSLASYLTIPHMSLSDAVTKACGFASMSVRRRGATYPTILELPDSLLVSHHHNDNDDHNNKSAKKRKPTITFVTGNQKKLEEVKQILLSGNDNKNDNLAFDIVNLKLDLPELQGDPIDIAREKCRLAAAKVDGPCFIEDTSLCFDALQGLPGPYIKYFLEKCGHEGLNRMLDGFDKNNNGNGSNSNSNNNNTDDKSNRGAYAQTILAFSLGSGNTGSDQQDIQIFEGRTNGIIVPARGRLLDFGWDPIFQPIEGKGELTYAEMDVTAKNAISHRARAMIQFRSYLLEHENQILESINKNNNKA